MSGYTPEISEINDPLFKEQGLRLSLLRLDLLPGPVSGNKGYKLKYILEDMKAKDKHMLVTFGGAWSNHLAAVAAAGHVLGFQTTGIVRGEQRLPLNPTLEKAMQEGMVIHYVNRALYRDKGLLNAWVYEKFGSDVYVVPEGGSNALAVLGCREILDSLNVLPDWICCACGTGATLAGLASSKNGRSRCMGFPVLRNGEFIRQEVAQLVGEEVAHEIELDNQWHFGGYAKITPPLVDFVQRFKREQGIQLDYIYTGKLLFGLYERIREGRFERGSHILAIHTGGVQGNVGIEKQTGLC
jgi:1-aminocyclopropane-1-carboxylate deaminase